MRRFGRVLVFAAFLLVAACGGSNSDSRPRESSTVGEDGARKRAQDRATQSDLRNALTAEKTYYIDGEEYTDDDPILSAIERSLDWGGQVKVFVGEVPKTIEGAQAVCLEATSASGTTFAIADIAGGPNVGTYYGEGAGCPNPVTVAALTRLGSSW
jgi:hypothetical protein